MMQPIHHTDLAEDVYARLRQAILSGELRSGDRLVEDQLAERLGVSRAPVRDALRRLDQDGFVVRTGRRGRAVSALSAHDAWEVYSLRAALEGEAIRLSIANDAQGLVAELEAIVSEMRRVGAAGDRQAMAALDVRFHESICRAAKHGRLLQAWESMSSQIRRLSNAVIQTIYDDPVEVPSRHAALIAALAARDPDAAERAVREHIDSVSARVMKVLPDAEGGGELDALREPGVAPLASVRMNSSR